MEHIGTIFLSQHVAVLQISRVFGNSERLESCCELDAGNEHIIKSDDAVPTISPELAAGWTSRASLCMVMQ